ncbi:hypothetical protein A9993_04335 [Rahnella victoriana]|uniref:DUF1496 domain-containing protein n=1 Tax=Rahnella victoriana TaxID=1510570 RepID=UPI000BB1A28E|nr:DUF1496 domain-containing protein [Rahnella victoriana]PBI78997.1 hypothetical protein A9993_04335 [Rahnella victoriana]
MKNVLMNNLLMALLAGSALLAAPAMANRSNIGNGTDVVVPLPPQIWENSGNNNNSAPTCHNCCIYNNQSYSEGAVVTADSAVLQCSRDPNVVGTNELKWEVLKK